MADDGPRHDIDDWNLPTTIGTHLKTDDEWLLRRLINYANRRDISMSMAIYDLVDMQLELEELYREHDKEWDIKRQQIEWQRDAAEGKLDEEE